MPIVIPGLQEALIQILTACTSLAQAISVLAAAATSQAEGGAQIPAARTPEQVVYRFQTPGHHQPSRLQLLRTMWFPFMPDDEQRRLERFGRLQPPSFSGTEGEDAQGFVEKVSEDTPYDRYSGDRWGLVHYFSVLWGYIQLVGVLQEA